MNPKLHKEGLHTITGRYALALACYAAATGLAFFNVWISLMIHLALGLVNARPERR